jgi:hypothetical protein
VFGKLLLLLLNDICGRSGEELLVLKFGLRARNLTPPFLDLSL